MHAAATQHGNSTHHKGLWKKQTGKKQTRMRRAAQRISPNRDKARRAGLGWRQAPSANVRNPIKSHFLCAHEINIHLQCLPRSVCGCVCLFACNVFTYFCAFAYNRFLCAGQSSAHPLTTSGAGLYIARSRSLFSCLKVRAACTLFVGLNRITCTRIDTPYTHTRYQFTQTHTYQTLTRV